MVEAQHDIPPIEAADGPVASWELNDDLFLHGFRVDGIGWLTVPGIAGYRFDVAGPVEAVIDGGSPDEVEDTWLRSVMPYVIQARGTQVLHASAIATERGVVALCGASMAGKSTLAAGLMTRGYEVLADDALAVESRKAVPIPFRLRPRASLQDLPGGKIVARAGGGESMTFASIVLLAPHGSGDAPPPKIEEVARVEVVAALMPHAYCFALDDGKNDLVAEYLSLARAVPVVRLRYPYTITQLAETLTVLEHHVR